MTTTLIKKKLTKAIKEIDDSDFLNALHIIVNSKMEEAAFQLSTAQQKELDRRRALHKTGKSKSYTWPEVKRSLLKK